MPPPPGAPQQGSKAVLISSLILSVILLIVAVVFWFNTAGERDQAQAALKREQDKWKHSVDLTSPIYTDREERAKADNKKVVDIVAEERDAVTQLILGRTGSVADATKATQGSIVLTNQILASANFQPDRGLSIPPTASLAGALPPLAEAIVALNTQVKAEQGKLTQLTTERDALVTKHTQDLAAKDALITAEAAKIPLETAKIEQARQAGAMEVARVIEDHKKQLESLNKAITDTQVVIQQKDIEIAKAREEVMKLHIIIKRFRMNAKENVIRQADGVITRVPGDGFCYINLGMGNQVPAGLTFEIYDKNKGVPKLGDGLANEEDDQVRRAAAVDMRKAGGLDIENDLPRGKGSLEVVAVGPGNVSQCRIIKIEPGETIQEGDVIANLLYDPKTKFKWFVYGDFDFAQNKTPRAQDTAVVKKIITQWGSQLQPIADPANPWDSVTIDTDFIVMGIEPVVPALTPEEMADAGTAARVEKLKQQLVQYQKVLDRAINLGIPVLNQTRFLYYTGYHDQAKRLQ